MRRTSLVVGLVIACAACGGGTAAELHEDDATSAPTPAAPSSAPSTAAPRGQDFGTRGPTVPDAGAELDAAADADAGACPPPATDPCDCRIRLDACPAGARCGVDPSCTTPFAIRWCSYRDFRLNGADGGTLVAGALCFDDFGP